MRRKAVLSAVLTLALAMPAFAGSGRSRDTAEAASSRIEAARQAVAAEAVRPAGPVEEGKERAAGRRSRDRSLAKAQRSLETAERLFANGEFGPARRHAERAEWLAWKASNPRKGER